MGTIEIIAQVASTVANGDVLTNHVCIHADTPDPDTTSPGHENCDTVPTVIGNFANVYIEKKGSTSTNVGGVIDYELSFGNNGNLVATDTTIDDILDTNVTFTPFTGTNTTSNTANDAIANPFQVT